MISKVKNMIKKRFINTKNRIYIQDSELMQTVFEPGKRYNYKFNKDDGSMLEIFIDDKGSKIVSKRKRKDLLNPVIDIRTKEVLEQFNKFDKMEIEIYKDKILVRGVLDTKVINLNKQQELIISKKRVNELYLKNVVNENFEQLTFENFINQTNLSSINISTKYTVNSQESYNKDIQTVLRLVSLFSGAGVLDKGFIDQGFTPKFALELEKDMVETYKYNLGKHIIQADINNYDINTIPDGEILIGGSPCQDLSNANRKTGKILDSPKNLLIRKYIEVAKRMRSLKVFVLENVSQLITKGRKFIEEIKQELSEFDITINKVNSSDFGSAQSRERVIIIGSKIGKIKLKEPLIKMYKTVRQAFEGLTNEIPNQLDYSIPKPETLFKMSFVKEGGNFKDIPEEYRGKGCHSNLFKRLEWNKPSITIANPRKSNILHPKENRILSIRECARLFDLPDTFIFKGKLSNKQQMIANAVPLKLATAIAKKVKLAFEEYKNYNKLAES
ncbi:DNA cytosine methyltransferase [uncultured Clostridium sp.]|uniref:DNA cytosine methyltransferase n=1 Tax=uncultured Clostridium sp. TaxID=59620 RepID=UPI0025886C8E|nr:DNA cytosine methyltransferase [uncultured Clostridium sp.]